MGSDFKEHEYQQKDIQKYEDIMKPMIIVCTSITLKLVFLYINKN